MEQIPLYLYFLALRYGRGATRACAKLKKKNQIKPEIQFFFNNFTERQKIQFDPGEMSKNTILFLALAGAAVILFYPKLQLGKKAKFYFKGIGLKGKKAVAKIAIQNPTNAQATLLSLAGDLYANGKLVSQVSSFDKKIILPNQETVLDFEFSPSVLGIVDFVSSTLQNIFKPKDKRQKMKLAFKFDGSANVDGFSIPVKLDYNV